jgi:hypothetical protein
MSVVIFRHPETLMSSTIDDLIQTLLPLYFKWILDSGFRVNPSKNFLTLCVKTLILIGNDSFVKEFARIYSLRTHGSNNHIRRWIERRNIMIEGFD